MHDRTVRDMSIEELRARVEEAEKILRVARRLAQDELRDPASSERAKDRIASLCSEVNALFPGLGQPRIAVPDTVPGAAEAEAEAEAEETEEVEAGDESEGEGEAGADEEDADEGEDADADADADEDTDDEQEWDVDYDKLRAALQNPDLMGRFPEGQRAEFKAMAEQLLDAHDRQELFARVTEGFAQLEETTRAGAEKVRAQLELVLTLEELRSKKRH
jgi:hypothetical protein